MRTKAKVLTLALCAVLLVVSTVFVTMAFLTDKDSVQNTFTFGQVGISLDEADVDKSGKVEAGEDRTVTTGRVQANEYHLIPGQTYVKDPTIHVDANSEDCWVFIELKNDLKLIIADITIENQMVNNGWTCIDEANHIWAYKEIVKAKDNILVFDNFKLADNAVVSNYATEKDSDGKITGGATIDVTAYAVQADGFDSAAAAWTAASDSFGN